MPHGDDIYGFNAPMLYPVQDTLMPFSPQWVDWFVPANPETFKNVGRNFCEAAIKYPHQDLLERYCQDLKENKSYASGEVFQFFSYSTAPPYTVSELEQKGLWKNLKKKLIQNPQVQQDIGC